MTNETLISIDMWQKTMYSHQRSGVRVKIISSPNRHNDVSDKKNKSWYVVMSIWRRFLSTVVPLVVKGVHGQLCFQTHIRSCRVLSMLKLRNGSVRIFCVFVLLYKNWFMGPRWLPWLQKLTLKSVNFCDQGHSWCQFCKIGKLRLKINLKCLPKWLLFSRVLNHCSQQLQLREPNKEKKKTQTVKILIKCYYLKFLGTLFHIFNN